MNEEEVLDFLQWVPSKIVELSEAAPEEVSEALNEIYETDGGPEKIEALISQYNSEKESFKSGGKIDFLAEKFKKGGRIKKCSCGCGIVIKKKKGGNVESCACGCKSVKKHQEGGVLVPKQLHQLMKGDTVDPTLRVAKADTGPGVEITERKISFNEAFGKARAAGLETFKWNGGLYGTKLANEVEKKSSPEVVEQKVVAVPLSQKTQLKSPLQKPSTKKEESKPDQKSNLLNSITKIVDNVAAAANIAKAGTKGVPIKSDIEKKVSKPHFLRFPDGSSTILVPDNWPYDVELP